MNERVIDSELTLVPYYKNNETALEWYSNLEVCKQVDNIDHIYSVELLNQMYDFLSSHGECYYIQYKGVLVGDVTLRNDNHEVCIVVCKEYQNHHIGRRCILEMIQLAKEKNFPSIFATIYSFNTQSQRMFLAIGFEKKDDEIYEYKIK